MSDPQGEPGPEKGGVGDDWPPFPTAEERAIGAELSALDLAEWAADLDAPVEACWVRDGGRDDSDEDAGPGSGLTDADVLDSLTGPATPVDLLAIDSIDLEGLADPRDRLRVVAALDRVIAHATARQLDALVAVAGTAPSGRYLSERHVEVEVAAARTTSHYSAGVAIERARTLHTVFGGFLSALRAGAISPAHAAVLVETTRPVTDPAVLAAIEARALPRAPRQTPGQLRAALVAAVASLDPDAPARHRAARELRRVAVRRLTDGMGYLGLTHDWTTIAAIEGLVRSDGRRLAAARGGPTAAAAGNEDACADAARADALAARLLGQVADDGSISWSPAPSRVEVQVVVDLATLRGETDRAALLDQEPVPAQIARDLITAAATTIGAWWRRVVTDPVTGHLLDYGTATYLPAPLRRHVLARDGSCRSPHCSTRHPDRLQLDHAVPFPDGPSDTANTGALCTTCHQLKTEGLLRLDHGTPDGAVTWTTAWGQTIHVPPRSYLPDPDPPPAPSGPPEDPPPF